MRFLELTIPSQSELGDFILSHFKSNKSKLSRDELAELVRGHFVYFQNKPKSLRLCLFYLIKSLKKAKLRFI